MADLETILERGQERNRLPDSAVRRHLRIRNGLTQGDVRDAVEVVAGRPVTRVTVNRWENGARTPRGDLLRAYLEVLDRLARHGD